MSYEAEETFLVAETACIFCEVQAKAEEIVDHDYGEKERDDSTPIDEF
jgi:hypothetical protein